MIKRFLFALVSLIPHITIYVDGKPYLTRYYLFWRDREWGNIYIHHFHASDQGIHLHNHPWAWGLSFVFWGGYYEERARNPLTWQKIEQSDPLIDEELAATPVKYVVNVNVTKRNVKAGSINVIHPHDYHRVDLKDEARGAWSIFFAGRRRKDWGFLDRNTGEFTHFSKNPEAIP